MLVLTTTRDAGAADCSMRTGAQVILRSSDFNPDVFVWDTRDRMVDYAVHVPYVTTETVLRHAVLAKAGTRAVVVGCLQGSVQPRFSPGIEDAVRVRIVSGAQRGRQGWIASSDLRGTSESR